MVRRFTGGALADREAVRARLTGSRGDGGARRDGFGAWALERRDDAVVVGEIDLVPLPGHDHVEVGWHLAPRWWGHGYATEAGTAAVGYGVDVLGLDTIVAVVDPRNHRSRAVARRVGLAPAGRWCAYGRSVDAFRLVVPPVDARQVRVRRVDADAVVGLRQRVLRPPTPPASLRADADVDAEDLAAVTLDRRVVGCARLCRDAPPWRVGDSRVWRLRNMAVSARARGLGLGGRLVDAVVTRADAVGAARLWCAARTPVEGFYARHGFVRVTAPWHDPELGWHVGMERGLR